MGEKIIHDQPLNGGLSKGSEDEMYEQDFAVARQDGGNHQDKEKPQD